MTMLEQQHIEQIEYNLGRSLTSEEREEALSVNEISEAQLEVGRTLAKQQLVLCVQYLRGIVPDLSLRMATQFMDAVLKYGEPAKTWKPGR